MIGFRKALRLCHSWTCLAKPVLICSSTFGDYPQWPEMDNMPACQGAWTQWCLKEVQERGAGDAAGDRVKGSRFRSHMTVYGDGGADDESGHLLALHAAVQAVLYVLVSARGPSLLLTDRFAGERVVAHPFRLLISSISQRSCLAHPSAMPSPGLAHA